jgi:hypothetical protein
MARENLFALAVGLLAIACQSGLDDPKSMPQLDGPYFDCKVQPILTKSCSTFACHGDARRFYRVFARNRLRAQGAEKDRNSALTGLERASNLDAARAFVDPEAVDQSLLLTKPLDASAGGAFHRGAELFGGGNVFANRDDPDFKTLAAWARGEKEDPKCIEPGSDQ